ncbi:MAG: cysteine desulfurase [Candidatus Methanomethylophilus sp.]|nr:cysteine desulfurase [Methanomethylophilus sp.]MDD4222525.1 cysteine desulfurase [Methanomethylophilus sp.]
MDMAAYRQDFPTMRAGKGVYLDSACQALRPDSVIAAVNEYYTQCPACGERSVHWMSNMVSVRVDEAREALCRFFDGADPSSFIFTRNTTEGLNTVAFGSGLKKGDAVVTGDAEHNSNYVPWLTLRDSAGLKIRLSRSGPSGIFDLESLKAAMNHDVKLVAIGQCSNVTGCVVPIKDIAEIAHDWGARILVDGAQGAPHLATDLKKWDIDYYAASLHKMCGPSGMGFLYGKPECLRDLRPLLVGGGTVGLVTYDHVDFAPSPDRFEAGLQDYAGIFGTKAALDYLTKVGMDNIAAHDADLMHYLFETTREVKDLVMVGPDEPVRRCGVFSFNIKGMGAHDVAMMLDSIDGIMVRSGMHCAHPFHVARGIEGSVRASVYLYNNHEDIDRFAAALKKVAATFGD